MRKRSWIYLIAFLVLTVLWLFAQTHIAGVLDVAQTWTATQTFSNMIDSGITVTPSTSPICPNGAGGLFTTSGCSSGTSGTFVQSSATNASIGATNIIASVASTPGMYTFDWEISLTVVGASCTGSTTVVLNDIFNDPAVVGTVTNPIGTITIAPNGNGTVGYVASGNEVILAKNATAVQYSTVYTAGAGCGTNPTYQVSYVATAVH